MVSAAWLSSFALLGLAIPVVKGQRNTCAANADGSQGARCLKRQGPTFASSFCSSFLPITTPVRTSTRTVTDTTTRVFTSFIDTTTKTFSPPATTILSQTATLSTTVTETSYDTVITGTITDFVATITVEDVSYSNVYTCPGDPVPLSSLASLSSSVSLTSETSATARGSSATLSFPTTSKNGTTGGVNPSGTISFGTGTGTGIGTGIGTIGTGVSSSFAMSGSLPYYTWTRSTLSSSSSPSSSSKVVPPYYSPPPAYTTEVYGAFGKEKRQETTTLPRCLRRLDIASGTAGISDACDCLVIATPSATQTVETVTDPNTTITKSRIIRRISTSVTTPTITATQSVNRTLVFTDYVTAITNIATTVPGTLTVTRTSVSTIVGPSPTPSTFNIFYTLNSTRPANFFQAGPAPGGSGIVLANEAQADFFSIDGMGRLTDVTAGNLFMAKNTQDLYPFALLQTNAEMENTPVCQACGGKLQCDFPGTEGNVFALCYGFLALGPRSVMGLDADENGDVDCRVVDLQFK